MEDRTIDEQPAEGDARPARTSSETQERSRQMRAVLHRTDKQISRTARQLARLDAKLGGGSERCAYEVLERLLFERLGMEFVSAHAKSFAPDRVESLQVDMLAYSVTTAEVIVVQVSIDFDNADLARALDTLVHFPRFFPEHRDKKLSGMIAAIDISDEITARVAAAGLLLVRLSSDSYILEVSGNHAA